jgi:hypothetical protein
VVAYALGVFDRVPRAGAADAAVATVVPPVDAATPALAIVESGFDAADVALAIDATPAAVATREPRTKRRPDRTTPVTPPVAVDARPSSPPPGGSQPIARGTLIVSSEPWAEVVIDDRPRRKTPMQLDLDPGRHTIVVDVSGDPAQHRATIEIASGKRTKCRATPSALACGTPE